MDFLGAGNNFSPEKVNIMKIFDLSTLQQI